MKIVLRLILLLSVLITVSKIQAGSWSFENVSLTRNRRQQNNSITTINQRRPSPSTTATEENSTITEERERRPRREGGERDIDSELETNLKNYECLAKHHCHFRLDNAEINQEVNYHSNNPHHQKLTTLTRSRSKHNLIDTISMTT